MDPITFEVLRHRLWAINDEQAMTAARMSGSAIVYEAYDFNTALVTPQGQGLFVGVYLARHATTIDLVVRSVQAAYEGKIFDGDMFITNDPWCGTVHQSDFCLVAPIFHEGEIVLWTGITMHEQDVGGSVPGSLCSGARDAYGESPLIPPLKIVSQKELQPDIERLYLRNSRTPVINALNLRARIGCQTATRARVLGVVEKYGRKTFLDVQDHIIEHVANIIGQRLKALPDGTWRQVGYLDHDTHESKLYPIRLAMTKSGGKLTFDFHGTAAQAPGPVNCTESGLWGGVMSALLPMMCFDVPWCVAGLKRVIENISDQGTVNNASFPAAVSFGTVAACWETTDVVSQTLAKMYMCSDTYKKEVMATWSPSSNGLVISGTDRHARPLTALWLGPLAGGGGARAFKDGIDGGGWLPQGLGSQPNVESGEDLYPILEVFRRYTPSSAGPGKHRGGLGTEYLLLPHKTKTPLTTVRYCHGVSQSEARGLAGGLSGAIQVQLLHRDADVFERYSAGRPVEHASELVSKEMTVVPAKGITVLGPKDAIFVVATGGGGYGDPLTRDAELVAREVAAGLCTMAMARDTYGVELAGDSPTVRLAETRARRDALRKLRIDQSQPVWTLFNEDEPPALCEIEGDVLFPAGEHIGDARLRCCSCHADFGPAHRDPKHWARLSEAPLADGSELNQYAAPEIIVRQFLCRGCGTVFAVDVQERSESVLFDFELAPSNFLPAVDADDKSKQKGEFYG
jgi:N-methylhydantoinase B